MSQERHVIFGAGQVGRPLAGHLIEAGRQVRVARRSAGAVPGAEVQSGDAADPAFCLAAAAGASTIYHCMNPAYDTTVWAELVPRYMNNLIAAAARHGARLVVLDNLYMLGRPAGSPLTEHTPMRPCSRKGEIRARAADLLFAAHARGEIRAASGRASDFYGPGGTQSGLGNFFWPAVFKGRTVYMPYPLDAVHTYHYIPDVAAGLAAIGCADDSVYGQPWMLPCTPPGTLRELIARLSPRLGRPIKVAQPPRWVLTVMAIGMPIMRELNEMLYQWDEPFVVDDRAFRERFGQGPTSPDVAADATVAWAREQYGAAA